MVIKEMIKKEVRSYMTRLKEKTGDGFGICMGMNMGMRGEDGFREVAVKRIGVSRID